MRGLQPTLDPAVFRAGVAGQHQFRSRRAGSADAAVSCATKRPASRVEEQNGYTSHPGIPALRDKIAEQYPHLDLPRTGVVVTCGSQEAMTDAFHVLRSTRATRCCCRIRAFPAYDACTRIAKATPVYYRMPADDDFAFDIADFKSRITTKTKPPSSSRPRIRPERY